MKRRSKQQVCKRSKIQMYAVATTAISQVTLRVNAQSRQEKMINFVEQKLEAADEANGAEQAVAEYEVAAGVALEAFMMDFEVAAELGSGSRVERARPAGRATQRCPHAWMEDSGATHHFCRDKRRFYRGQVNELEPPAQCDFWHADA